MKLKKETDYIKVPVKVKSSISKTGRVIEEHIAIKFCKVSDN